MSNKTAATAATAAQNGYEAKVIAEALERAGSNPHLKGHIHEILYRDALNAAPARILRGETASLVRSRTAECVDVVVTRGGKVVERLQLKDTPASALKTIQQMNAGKYNSARVIGTKETAQAVAKHADKLAGGKAVSSSGISSETTMRLAQKAGAQGSGTLGQAVGAAAKASAKTGAGVSAALALAKGVYDLANDEKTVGEVAHDVAKETTGGAVSAAAGSAAATVAGGLLASVALPAAAPAAVAVALTVGAPVVIGIGVACMAKEVCDGLWDGICGLFG